MVRRHPSGWQGAFRHVNDCVKRHGFATGLRLGVQRARRLAYCYETQVWYHLRLEGPRPRLSLPPALSLVKVGRRDRHFVHQLPNLATDDALGRLAAGRDLWVVHDRGRVLFASWIVRARMEAISTRDIDFALPDRVVGLDDAIGAPAVLGRGIATAAWSQMADAIRAEGMTAIVSKVGETDLAGRRAMELAGFRAVASVELQRVGRYYWADVRPYEPGGLASHLAAHLPSRGEIAPRRSA